jgi:hypothetical protein
VLAFYPRPLRLNVDHWLSFAEEQPVRLNGSRLNLDLLHGFRIVEALGERGRFKVETIRYSYTLLDRSQRELIAYHHHPSGASWCTCPHLHVGTATGDIDNKAHLATGWVSLPTVIRMLIEDPSIPVTPVRRDWALVLDASKGSLERH